MNGVALLESLDGGVALLRLGHPDERVITLTPERIESIKKHLQTLRSKPPLGLVIAGPSLEMFTVGADINLIQEVTDAQLGAKLAKIGQDLFLEIEQLPFPTVAAISGPCVGGGCELVLACKHRIISDSKSSMIGLPETKLGILPGFGGTQRLPRLVGIPKALDIILAGKTLRPKQALSAKLVDEVIPGHALIERARKVASGSLRLPKRALSFQDKIFFWSRIARSWLKKKAKESIQKETKGYYPAPLAALEMVFYGIENGLEAGYKKEAEELGKLIVSSESKGLVHVFFLSESSKNLGRGGSKQLENIATSVIGGGVMGAGIASVLAKSDYPVILRDTSEEALQKAKAHIRNYADKLKYLSEPEKSALVSRVEATSQDTPALANVSVVVEAIVENLAIKQKVFSDIAKLVSPNAILASNTSSLSISAIAESIPSPERVVGMHFFNPVEKMPLVEIVMGSKTSDRTIALIAALTVKLGKYPIVVKDVPGFLINRILTPYLNEAALLLQEGYSISDIDQAATSFGLPMGPVRLLDEVGLDVASHVSKIMLDGYGDRMATPPLAEKLVATGALGKKNGVGFYDFSGVKPKPRTDLRQVLALGEVKENPDKTVIQQRLILSLVNEAVRCFDEGVAGAPGKEAAAQVDLGSVMGFGFPPFRGGILYWAQKVGAAHLVTQAQNVSKHRSFEFKLWEGIERRAKDSSGLY